MCYCEHRYGGVEGGCPKLWDAIRMVMDCKSGMYHLVCLVELHLYSAQSSLALLALGILGVALELVADALDDLLEVLLIRVKERSG